MTPYPPSRVINSAREDVSGLRGLELEELALVEVQQTNAPLGPEYLQPGVHPNCSRDSELSGTAR